MNERDAMATWECLKTAIQHIHNHNAGSLSFEELYRNAYSLVLHKYGELLYKGVQDTVKEHLKQVANRVICATDDELLNKLQDEWQDHRTTMIMIRDILMYMDRNFVGQYRKVPVFDLGLHLFREEVSGHGRVKDRLLTILLKNIQNERDGQQIDRILMKNTIQMLVELGVQSRTVYKDNFEDFYLAETERFYTLESQRYISENGVPDYLKKAESRISEETKRVDNYLHSSSLDKVMAIMDAEWIQKHHKALVHAENSGCAAMFNDDKKQDLKRLFQLFKRVPDTLVEVREVMRKCIVDRGEEILKDPERVKEPVMFIDALLDLKKKYDSFVKESFGEAKEFQTCLKAAFESFINKDTRTAQFLSLYVDELFKKTVKGLTDADIEAKLEQVVTIFRFLQDKDVFENYYKQHLSKRLLHQRSLSEEAEKQMIQKLKSECGHLYTSKLEGMFTDIRLSDDLMKDYRRICRTQGQGSRTPCVELKVHVLTTGYWPNASNFVINMPREISDECDHFKSYYLGKHTGRRLTWQYNLGTADIKATLPKSRHDLNCTTYQMCILYLFNQRDKITYKEIQELTQIPIEELKRHLMSLYVSPKCKLLLKTNAAGNNQNKDIADDDVFEVNPGFESKLVRLKVPLVAVGSKGLEGSGVDSSSAAGAATTIEVPANVEEDRKHLIEAAIVRIMKMRKKLEHNQLVVEVTKHLQTRFNPTPTMIKQRIEKLIEREYLERSQEDRRMYNYLA